MADFEIVGADAELHAEIVRRFEVFNRDHTNWGAETYSAVKRRGGRVVAAARGITNMGLVEIRGVWVDPDLRGNGLGRGVVAAVEDEARRRGCTRAARDT